MQTKQNVSLLFVMLAFVIFFTTGDLIANVNGSYVIASICSILSGFIVFLGTAIKKKENLEKGINKSIDYLCSNFNKANVILSILDIVCSIIALFTFVVMLGVIFRSILALRLIVTLNKVKTVLQAILIATTTYLTIRFNKIKEMKMFKKIGKFFKTIGLWLWANKKTMCGTLFALLSGVIAAIAVNAEVIATFPALMIFGLNWTPVIAGVLIALGVEVGVVGKGFEFIKEYFARKEAEKQENLIAKTEKAEAKAKAKEEKAKAIEEAKAKEIRAKEEEKARLLAIAAKIEAKEKAIKNELTQVLNRIVNEVNNAYAQLENVMVDVNTPIRDCKISSCLVKLKKYAEEKEYAFDENAWKEIISKMII